MFRLLALNPKPWSVTCVVWLNLTSNLESKYCDDAGVNFMLLRHTLYGLGLGRYSQMAVSQNKGDPNIDPKLIPSPQY